ncbi:hypothetical protein GCM10010398_09200 [Streptomyces fimbriatus]
MRPTLSGRQINENCVCGSQETETLVPSGKSTRENGTLLPGRRRNVSSEAGGAARGTLPGGVAGVQEDPKGNLANEGRGDKGQGVSKLGESRHEVMLKRSWCLSKDV